MTLADFSFLILSTRRYIAIRSSAQDPVALRSLRVGPLSYDLKHARHIGEAHMETTWNVRLPEGLTREVLAALDAQESELQLGSVVRRNPELRTEILLWAQQARGFQDISTRPVAFVGEDAMSFPTAIGSYNILSPLGAGGFARVFLGEHRESGQKNAIKLLQRQDRQSTELIELEFQLLASLDHPAVIEVHEYGLTETGRPYYSMDYIAGLPLDAAFKTDVFSNEDLVASLVQLSDSLSYVHHKHLVHRDIKPQNVLIDNDQVRPCAHLVDFGIAAVRVTSDLDRRRLSMVKGGQLFQQTLFTEHGQIVGTPGFMAPEQFLANADSRSDIYALGVTTYLLLTGRFPVDPHAIVNAWNKSARAAVETIESTRIVKPTEAVRFGKEHSKLVNVASLASARLTRGLTDRQQRILNTTLIRALQSDAQERHTDAAEFGEELATAFGLVPQPHFLLEPLKRVVSWARRRFQRAPSETDPRTTRVWFITDRAKASHPQVGYYFGSEESDELSFGYSLVKLPEWRVMGRTKPLLWERILGNAGYQVVENRIVDKTDFEAALPSRGTRKDMLLFVHGYNTVFEDAILRSAQFQTDLKMAGQVICYSWPSHGSAWSYGRDAAVCEESENCFLYALHLLTSVCDRGNLHVLAHSMGNRLLLQACHSNAASGPAFAFGQVIIAAPDIAQRKFRQHCNAYSGATRRTMYSSKHDRALMGSRLLHARGRAGYIPPLLIVDDVDTIDASVHGMSLWGLNHSTFGSARALLTDISSLIRHDLAPELRIGLDRRVDPATGRVYWVCIP